MTTTINGLKYGKGEEIWITFQNKNNIFKAVCGTYEEALKFINEDKERVPIEIKMHDIE